MGAQMAMPPFFVISEATKPIRRMFKSRCSLENPSSEDRCLRTISPSSRMRHTGRPPISRNFTRRTFAVVDLPAPDKPVKKSVKPCSNRGLCVRLSSASTSGKVNQSGIFSPWFRWRRSSVPDTDIILAPLGTSSQLEPLVIDKNRALTRIGESLLSSIDWRQLELSASDN